MPSQVPGNEEGMPQADDRRDACVPESRGRAGNPSVEAARRVTETPARGTRPSVAFPRPPRTPALTCPRAGLEGAQTAQDGPEGAGGLADPGRGVAGAALRRCPLPFPEGQVQEPQQCWPLLLGSWELHDLC